MCYLTTFQTTQMLMCVQNGLTAGWTFCCHTHLASHRNSDLYMKNYVSSECLCNLNPIHCPNGDILAHTFGLYVKTEKVYGFQTQPHCGDCRLSASES